MASASLNDTNPFIKTLELTWEQYSSLLSGELTYTFEFGNHYDNFLDKDLLKAYCINSEGKRMVCYCIIDEYYLTGDYIPFDKNNPENNLTKDVRAHLTLQPIDFTELKNLPTQRSINEKEIKEVPLENAEELNQPSNLIIGSQEISFNQNLSIEESVLIKSFLKQLLE